MFGIGIRMLRIPHECLELAFDCFKSLGLCIPVLPIPFKWLELAFECFEWYWNDWNWHSIALNAVRNGCNWDLNPSNSIRMVGICIRVVRIPFEWLELAFECFESRLNGWNWHSMLWMPFKWLELAFECFESCSNGWNWHLSAIRTVGIGILMFRMLCEMVGIGIRILQIPFEWLEFAFECFKCLSNGLNYPSNAWNLVRMVRICI